MLIQEKKKIGSLFALFFALAAAVCAAEELTDRNLLFHATFDSGFPADYSRGESQPFLTEAMARLGVRDGVLRLSQDQLFCYPAAGNIDFGEGTILMRLFPGRVPGGSRDKYEADQLFAMRNRVGQRLDARIDDCSGELIVSVSTRLKKETTLKLDVKKWKPGEFRSVVVSWKKPGNLFLAVEGLGHVSTDKADLPDCPVEFLYDIYVGSNAQGLIRQQYGRLNTFSGQIDDFRIYDVWHDQAIARLPESTAKNAPGVWPKTTTASPEWVGLDAYRINFALGKTHKEWRNNPVKIELNLEKELGSLDLAARRKAIATMRLVAFDPASGKPVVFSPGRKGDDRYFRPFQLDCDFLNRMSGTLTFLHSGPLPAAYSLYFDKVGRYDQAFPVEYPLAGSGTPMMVGSKDLPGVFAGGFRGAFDPIDFDGDGDVDLFFVSGWQTESGRDLPNGLFYYENRRDRYGYDRFAAPVLIDRGQNEFGRFAQTAPPLLADIDGDGKTECVFVSKYLCAYAKVVNDGGRPRLADWKKLKFDGKTPPLVSSAILHDFNGDGLLDVFSDGFCHFNIGTRENPLFSSKRTDLFSSGVRGKDGLLYNHFGEQLHDLAWALADIDGDGRPDLICGGVKSTLYYFPQSPDGKFGNSCQLRSFDGHELEFPGVFPFVRFRDLDGDGSPDMLISTEDGTLGCAYNMAAPGEAPALRQPVHLYEDRPHLNGGCIAVPVAFDWNGDGRLDILAGGANGRILLWENIGTAELPVYRNPRELMAGDRPIVLRAGPNGSIQGEGENDWGYVNIEVADWDMDGLPDLIASGVRGDHTFFRNIGTRTNPELAPGELITVDFEGGTPVPAGFRYRPRSRELLTVHRCRPNVFDWNGDGLPDYLVNDHEDRFAVYERYRRPDGTLGLKEGKRIFKFDAPFFRSLIWNHETLAGMAPKPGGMGRSVNQIVDWNKDGKPDLIIDNINGRILLNTSADRNHPVMTDAGDLAGERLANHNAAPYAADLDGDGELDLIVGTESGWIYGFLRPYLERDTPPVVCSPIEEKSK